MPDPRAPSGPAARPSRAPQPEIRDLLPEAEVQVLGGQVLVTVGLPEIAPESLGHFVGSNLVLVWSRADPERSSTLVHLPVDVRPDTSVARFQNGVFDLTVLAADPAVANRPRRPAHVETAADGPGHLPYRLPPTDPTVDGSQ